MLHLKIGSLAVCIAVMFSALAQADQQPTHPWKASNSPGLAALSSAAEMRQFSYVLFWRDDNDATQRMNAVLSETKSHSDVPINTIRVQVTEPAESETVEVFGVQRAPLPLIVAVAPNGAVTKAWPLKATAEQLRAGIVSEGTASCLKAMQAQKLSLICVSNQQTPHHNEVQLAANGFLADQRFGAATEVITIDPADQREQAFLTSLKISPTSHDSAMVLISPAGQPIAKFTGAVTSAELIAKVESAQQGCCPGGQCGPNGQCGPGQCCPGGQCPPQ
ncbi:MAG: hypothetical protein ACF8CQ_07050 [Rhodopirellula sp. JB044]|uniref:hypothetical protein n=1 Tax=Rhodopirellula sp. JB044 TaxID=3342844 RepID=UPI00370C935F